MAVSTPRWVRNAVFYQVFPDRFARGSVEHAPAGITFKEWGSPPAEQGYQGGDLYGVAEKLEYLKSLGVTAIYLNPIFSSASNHRYHTFDYLQVDPLLGGDQALRVLLDQAHSLNMKVVLDGVFNHASRGFWAFHHILENGPTSPYLDWFHIEDFPLNPYPTDESEDLNYRAWWDLPALPKFNTDNPGVRDYLFRVAEYWVEFGIDGWRLDVPGDIDDDSFWREFRSRVKARNPEAYICGEIWDNAQRWLQGDQFDAVMNYPMGTAALSFFGAATLRSDYQQNNYVVEPIGAEECCERIQTVLDWYDADINHVQMNLIDSHDTPRARWLVQDESVPVQQSLALLMLMPGAPCIYYGTEIGMSGANDPECRGAFPWANEVEWDGDVTAAIQRFATIRHKHEFLMDADVHLDALNDDVLLLQRHHKGRCLWAFFNRGVEQDVIPPSPDKPLFQLDPDGKQTDIRLKTQIFLKKNAIEVFVA